MFLWSYGQRRVSEIKQALHPKALIPGTQYHICKQSYHILYILQMHRTPQRGQTGFTFDSQVHNQYHILEVLSCIPTSDAGQRSSKIYAYSPLGHWLLPIVRVIYGLWTNLQNKNKRIRIGKKNCQSRSVHEHYVLWTSIGWIPVYT